MQIYFLDKPGELEKELHNGDCIYNSYISDVANNTGAELSQSHFWYDFTTLEKKEAFRVLILDSQGSSNVLATAFFIKNNFSIFSLFNFSYLYCPRGPIFNKDVSLEEQEEVFSALMLDIKKRYGVMFFRFETCLNFKEVINRQKRFFKKSIDLQPAKTLMLDLSKSEEEILAEMHQKTRYNIRLARKKGIKIEVAATNIDNKEEWENDFNDFWQLMKKTSSRDAFNIHAKEHYRFLLLTNPNVVKLFFAQYQGKRIAAGIFSFFADKVTYLHGASDNEYRNLMAPHLLQYELIMKGKNESYGYYDFYGIDEKKWPGVTKFKTGFGGFIKEYSGTYDYIFKPFQYFIYNIFRKIRRIF